MMPITPTRLEVIDQGGRLLVVQNQDIQIDIQDDGKTLKIFMQGETDEVHKRASY